MIKVHGLQFVVIGVFKERVESFGQSELAKETILIPITVIRYFTSIERIDPMYVQVKRGEDIEPVTNQVRTILESRHRAGARYRVENLTAILGAARNISLILQGVLILISAIALLISGIGIMNIMLVTVTERTREIGVRMAIGASRREILQQFLIEAVLISLSGGLAGILVGRGDSAFRRVLRRGHQDPDLGHLDRGCVLGVVPCGPDLRAAPGEPRGALEPDRSAALRVSGVGQAVSPVQFGAAASQYQRNQGHNPPYPVLERRGELEHDLVIPRRGRRCASRCSGPDKWATPARPM